MLGAFWACAYATSSKEFDEAISEVEAEKAEAAAYLLQIAGQHMHFQLLDMVILLRILWSQLMLNGLKQETYLLCKC